MSDGHEWNRGRRNLSHNACRNTVGPWAPSSIYCPAMGKKRQTALAGLSRFVLEAFKQSEEPFAAPENKQLAAAFLKVPGIAHKVPEAQDADVAGPLTKKRKVGLLGPGYEKYDATGLVPYYTEPSEVPDRLRKCM
jgi:trimethylguanosine synthase